MPLLTLKIWQLSTRKLLLPPKLITANPLGLLITGAPAPLSVIIQFCITTSSPPVDVDKKLTPCDPGIRPKPSTMQPETNTLRAEIALACGAVVKVIAYDWLFKILL